jgi:hypothetical protein
MTVLIPYLIAFTFAIWPIYPTDDVYADPQGAWEIGQMIWTLLMMTFTGGTFLRQVHLVTVV